MELSFMPISTNFTIAIQKAFGVLPSRLLSETGIDIKKIFEPSQILRFWNGGLFTTVDRLPRLYIALRIDSFVESNKNRENPKKILKKSRILIWQYSKSLSPGIT